MSVPVSTESQQAYRTPRPFFEWVHSVYGFTLDAAADAENALLPRFYSEADDTLKQTPVGERIWINPPFKRIKAFIKWAIERARAGNLVVMLLPSSLETEWFRCYATQGEVAVLWPRLPYIHPDPAERPKKQGPPCTSILVHFAPEMFAANEDAEGLADVGDGPGAVTVSLLEIPEPVIKACRALLREAA